MMTASISSLRSEGSDPAASSSPAASRTTPSTSSCRRGSRSCYPICSEGIPLPRFPPPVRKPRDSSIGA